MTKKRFTKLAISHEIQRNEAQKRAESVMNFKTYDALYESHSLEFAAVRFGRSMDALRKIAACFMSCVAAFIDEAAAAYSKSSPAKKWSKPLIQEFPW